MVREAMFGAPPFVDPADMFDKVQDIYSADREARRRVRD